jgi:hypothetical protein
MDIDTFFVVINDISFILLFVQPILCDKAHKLAAFSVSLKGKSFVVFSQLHLNFVIGCVTAMYIRLRALLHRRRTQADAVVSYANSMKGVTCDTSAS